MNHKKAYITGIVGTLLVLLCCTTPLLVVLLGFVGLGAITGYLDYILIPILAAFLILTLHSYNKMKKYDSKNDSCCL